MTVEQNINTYTSGIDTGVIPQTIRDAVSATHQLGFRYLWVDSFCIIQDSREDKTREISQMRRIFRDAYITLIASSAPSASAGFLQDRPPSEDPRIPFHCQDGRLGSVSLVPLNGGYNLDDEPVNQRAWCLEERLLSPRKLVYASDTLQYHCQTKISYVGDAIAVDLPAQRLPNAMFLSDIRLATAVPTMTPLQKRDMRWAWADTLSNYTKRTVTHQKDKLEAIAGVAEQFHRVWTGSRYLAGLWEEFLVQDLQWMKTTDTPLRPRPEVYLGPSWSWASVDGHVTMYHSLDRLLNPPDDERGAVEDIKACEVVGCEVALRDERLAYGRVTSAKLTIRAAMVETTWAPGGSEPKLLWRKDSHEGSLVVRDTSTTDPAEMAGFVEVASVFPDSSECINDSVWAVPLQWNVQLAYAVGLLVTGAADGNGICRRIAYWEAQDPDFTGTVVTQNTLAWFESSPLAEIEIVQPTTYKQIYIAQLTLRS